MSKDFEKEYKKLALDEAPDLWDRIEAGLSEKSTPEEEPKKGENRTGKAVTVWMKRYAGAVAAGLCVAIIIPAVILMGRSGSKSFSEDRMADTDMAAGEAALPEPQEERVVGEAALPEPQEERVAGEAILPESEEEEAALEAALPEPEEKGAMKEDALPESEEKGAMKEAALPELEVEAAAEESRGEKTEAAPEEAKVADNLQNKVFTEDEGSMEDRAGADSASQSSEAEKKREETVKKLEKVSVSITSELKADAGSKEGLEGQRFEAVVEEDASGCLTEGEKIVILVPSHSSAVAAVGDKALEMDLIYDSEQNVYLMQKLY